MIASLPKSLSLAATHIPLAVHCHLPPTPVHAGLTDGSSKVQVAFLNLLNQALSQPELAPQLAGLLGSQGGQGLLPAVLGVLDHALPLLRAKAVVCVVQMCRCARWRQAADSCSNRVGLRSVPCACPSAPPLPLTLFLRRTHSSRAHTDAPRLSPGLLLECCRAKLVLHMERVTRDKDAYTLVRRGARTCIRAWACALGRALACAAFLAARRQFT